MLELTDSVEEALLARACGRGVGDLATYLRGTDSPRNMAAVEDGLAQMRRRKEVLADAYPFGTGDDVVVPSSGALDTPYSLLLLLSRLPAEQIERGNEVLDAVVECAVESLLGPGTVTAMFAWPPRLSGDPRPEEFPAAIRWLGEKIGVKVGIGYRAPSRRDGGVDLVAVRPLAGSSLGCAVVLVQTTLSRDTRTKSRDVDLGLWRTWLDLGPAASSSLAIAHEAGPDLEELHASGHLVIDRLRMCELLLPRALDEVLSRDAIEWSRGQWTARVSALKDRP